MKPCQQCGRFTANQNQFCDKCISLPKIQNQHASWDKDEDYKNCEICNAEFGVFTRHHHCRSCEKNVCNNCSKHKFGIGAYVSEQRVCVKCHHDRDAFIQQQQQQQQQREQAALQIQPHVGVHPGALLSFGKWRFSRLEAYKRKKQQRREQAALTIQSYVGVQFSRLEAYKRNNQLYQVLNLQSDLMVIPAHRIDESFFKVIAIGDLNGDWLKLVYFLVSVKAIEISKEEYNVLAKAYPQSDTLLGKTSAIKHLKEMLKKGVCKSLLIFIGDVLSDRGMSDYVTLYIFNWMIENSILFKVIFSNHDCVAVGRYQNNMQPDVGHRTISKEKPFQSWDFNILDNDNQELFKAYIERYIKFLVLAQKIDKVIFTHAPTSVSYERDLQLQEWCEAFEDYKAKGRIYKEISIKQRSDFRSIYGSGEDAGRLMVRQTLYSSQGYSNVFGHVGPNYFPETEFHFNLDTGLGNAENLYTQGNMRLFCMKYHIDAKTAHPWWKFW